MPHQQLPTCKWRYQVYGSIRSPQVSTYGLVQEGMLETFLKGIEAAKVSNYLVVALDRETEKALNDQKRNVFYMDVKARGAVEILVI